MHAAPVKMLASGPEAGPGMQLRFRNALCADFVTTSQSAAGIKEKRRGFARIKETLKQGGRGLRLHPFLSGPTRAHASASRRGVEGRASQSTPAGCGSLCEDVTDVTRLRRQVQACTCPPQWWRHSVEVRLVISLPRSAAGRPYRPCGQAVTRQSIARGEAILPALRTSSVRSHTVCHSLAAATSAPEDQPTKP
eukprot:364495-Chlamydomonas_euryale.AAC.6